MHPYTVVGAGAIGGSLAAHLARAGHRVTVIDADPAHAAAIREHGIRLKHPDGTVEVVPVAESLSTAEAEARDFAWERVLLATKAQHVATAAAWIAPRLAENGIVVLCQNGDTVPSAEQGLDRARILPAFINFAADVIEPGLIRVGGPGAVAIGEIDGPASDRVRAVVDDLSAFGEVTASDSISGLIWGKRGVATIFTATALMDAHISDVIDTHRELFSELADEVYRVAARKGVTPLPFDGIEPAHLTPAATAEQRTAAFDRLVAFTRAMPGKERSGVFHDLAVRKRPTEARPELVALAAEAAELGVETPLLLPLAELIGELERGERQFSATNLDDLAAALRP